MRRLLLFCFTLLLAACGNDQTSAPAAKNSPAATAAQKNPSASPSQTLRLLVGSELKDIEPLLPDLAQATGVQLNFTYAGTLDGIDRLAGGESFDGAWFSHAKYLMLNEGTKAKVKAQEKIMLSPVVLGVKASRAKAYGWGPGSKITWADVAQKVKSDGLKFAMTNPTSSNSGFSAVIGVAAALAGVSDALEADKIDNNKLRDFYRGQQLTAGSSGWLADIWIREQNKLDAMINYESVLLSLNRNPQLQEKLVLIYPVEGIITADYPLLLLDDQKRAAYDKVVAYLKQPAVQARIAQQTLRRPTTAGVTLPAEFPKDLIVELPFPASIDTVNRILFGYLNDQRRPAHSFFVLDVSGSMQGQRIRQLQTALNTLAGDDTSLTGRFARFQERERVTLLTFNHRPGKRRDIDIGRGTAVEQANATVREFSRGLNASGGTAIFDAVLGAVREADRARGRDPERYYTVVLMTDGQNTSGMKLDAFLTAHEALPESARQIKVFPIIFGEADRKELNLIAEVSGGRVFDGNKANLSNVFKEIRGYQ